jgi:hypothetical protein
VVRRLGDHRVLQVVDGVESGDLSVGTPAAGTAATAFQETDASGPGFGVGVVVLAVAALVVLGRGRPGRRD